MSVNATNDFSKGKVWRHIVAQAVPLTLAQLTQLLYNIVDRVYIGHLPGADSTALTGLGLTFPVVTLIAAFTALFSSGGTPLFSIARGAGDISYLELCMKGKTMAADNLPLVIVGALALAGLYILATRLVMGRGGKKEGMNRRAA
jgi:Na+-driven multidrug efflux pump